MLALHFGAGNIGRGFIGEVLYENGANITFVDVNQSVIHALNERNEYTIQLAEEDQTEKRIDHVSGINNGENPDAVVEKFNHVDIITTAIGPKVLPHIAPLIAQGISLRKRKSITQPLDVIACENMIGGSAFLKNEVLNHVDEPTAEFIEKYIGFPNAAVDRIVPGQSHDDVLQVTVEPYKEWVIADKERKNKELYLTGAKYADNLSPYIERKLFTVNTGHATTAYIGKSKGHHTIAEALEDPEVLAEVRAVLEETGALIVEKWGLNSSEHQEYINKIINRFQNPHISDDITRVGRGPIRKLGYEERFIQPLREANERGLPTEALIRTIGKIFAYDDPNDEESVELQKRLKEEDTESLIKDVTGLTDEKLVGAIKESVN